MRMAVVIAARSSAPHNHPMPPMVKASLDIKNMYVKCIEAAGAMGSTVKKIDNGKSDSFIMELR
jgi:hypothetical protein